VREHMKWLLGSSVLWRANHAEVCGRLKRKHEPVSPDLRAQSRSPGQAAWKEWSEASLMYFSLRCVRGSEARKMLEDTCQN
jgi:hypothetical protein